MTKKEPEDLISRVTSDIDAIQDFISSALLGTIVEHNDSGGNDRSHVHLNWRFTLIALGVAPFLFFIVFRYTRRIKQASRAVRKKESEVVSTLEEVLSSIRVVKAYAREDYEQRRFEKESLSVETALQARSLKAKLAPIVEIIVAGGTCVVLWYGARLVLTNQLTPGNLILFILYLGNLYKPMRDLSKMTDTFSKAVVGFERIREVLETERMVKDLPKARIAPVFRGDIEFSHVAFGYQKDKMILEDMSFMIEAGQVAAFVGPTGAGKTTIMSLIPRFYDPISGQVKIDGVDVRNFKQRSLRQQISFVLQENLLFRAPIWQNIAYGKPEAKRDDIIQAAKIANAHEFIEKLSDGYDTLVGERGVTLSGGQRQRVAIARAVIRKAPILIMDEPTSSLDSASEELVFEALNRLMKGKTCIVIAHRLTTIKEANVIFVVSAGRIAEKGTHQQLLDLGGLYSELYNIQFHTQDIVPARAAD